MKSQQQRENNNISKQKGRKAKHRTARVDYSVRKTDIGGKINQFAHSPTHCGWWTVYLFVRRMVTVTVCHVHFRVGNLLKCETRETQQKVEKGNWLRRDTLTSSPLLLPPPLPPPHKHVAIVWIGNSHFHPFLPVYFRRSENMLISGKTRIINYLFLYFVCPSRSFSVM